MEFHFLPGKRPLNLDERLPICTIYLSPFINIYIKPISNPSLISTYAARLPFWRFLAPRTFHIPCLHPILHYFSEARVFKTSFQAAFEIPGWRSGMLASKNHLVSIGQSVLSRLPVLANQSEVLCILHFYEHISQFLKLHCVCKLVHPLCAGTSSLYCSQSILSG